MHEIAWKKVEIEKLYEDIELVVNLFEYTFYYLLLFNFNFIYFCKYLFVYVYLLCTELVVEQIRNFCLNKGNNSVNMF